MINSIIIIFTFNIVFTIIIFLIFFVFIIIIIFIINVIIIIFIIIIIIFLIVISFLLLFGDSPSANVSIVCDKSTVPFSNNQNMFPLCCLDLYPLFVNVQFLFRSSFLFVICLDNYMFL